MKLDKYWPAYVSFALCAAGVVVFARYARWDAIALNLNPLTVAQVFAPLILTAGFIERAVEVIISPWRDLEASRHGNRLKAAKTQAALRTQQATTASAAALIDPAATGLAQKTAEAANAAIDNAADAADQFAAYRGKTKQYAFAVALILGLLVAYSGMRGLANLCTLQGVSPHQRLMFNVTDVVVSAALLAGGANGIHSVVSAFTTFFNKTAAQSEQNTPPPVNP